MRIFNIIQGWTSYFFDSKIDKDRLMKCYDCEFAVQKKYLTFVKDDFKEVEGKVCSKCDCPLSAKLRSTNEKCPIGKW